MSIKTIFLDRDGVINKDKNYLYKIDDFEFITGIFESCNHFQKLGYKIIVITNQSGLSRGFYNKKDFIKLSNWMLNQFKIRGIDILDIFYCPHNSDSDCKCRKPKPGMFLQAQEKYNINMKKSWMIGDKDIDIYASNAAGVKNTILLRSGYSIEENSNASFTVSSLKDTARIIVD
jgi:D-glycero-D-manno-heptose 1,7-bisphosphate phosphatase